MLQYVKCFWCTWMRGINFLSLICCVYVTREQTSLNLHFKCLHDQFCLYLDVRVCQCVNLLLRECNAEVAVYEGELPRRQPYSVILTFIGHPGRANPHT